MVSRTPAGGERAFRMNASAAAEAAQEIARERLHRAVRSRPVAGCTMCIAPLRRHQAHRVPRHAQADLELGTYRHEVDVRLELLAQARADHLAVVAAESKSMQRLITTRGRAGVHGTAHARHELRRSGAASQRRRRSTSVVHDRLAPRLEVVADLVLGADQRQLLDELVGTAAAASSFFPVQVQVLDRASPPPRSRAARRRRGGSSRRARPCRRSRARTSGAAVGRLLDVVVDDHRHRRRDLEVVPRAPRAVAREALRERVR